MLTFKRIVTTATQFLVANTLPIFRLRDLFLDVNNAGKHQGGGAAR
jgi:hypothetical protein